MGGGAGALFDKEWGFEGLINFRPCPRRREGVFFSPLIHVALKWTGWEASEQSSLEKNLLPAQLALNAAVVCVVDDVKTDNGWLQKCNPLFALVLRAGYPQNSLHLLRQKGEKRERENFSAQPLPSSSRFLAILRMHGSGVGAREGRRRGRQRRRRHSLSPPFKLRCECRYSEEGGGGRIVGGGNALLNSRGSNFHRARAYRVALQILTVALLDFPASSSAFKRLASPVQRPAATPPNVAEAHVAVAAAVAFRRGRGHCWAGIQDVPSTRLWQLRASVEEGRMERQRGLLLQRVRRRAVQGRVLQLVVGQRGLRRRRGRQASASSAVPRRRQVISPRHFRAVPAVPFSF